MGPIVIGIDPIIVHFGPLALRWYSLAVVAGVAAAIWLAIREARRKGLPEGLIADLAVWAIPAGIVGARLLHVIDRWPAYALNPATALAFNEGGLSIQGAILGGFVAVVLVLWRRGITIGPVADAVAPGLLLGQAIGRLGCLVTGDALGAPTTAPWGVAYTNPGAMAPQLGVPFEPVFGYEGLWDLGALLILWQLRTRLRPDGSVFAAYLVLYGLGKFLVSFARQEVIWIWGLQEAHLIAIGIVVAGFVWLVRNHRLADSSPRAECGSHA